MNKILLILMFSLFIVSCKNDEEQKSQEKLEHLQKENEKINNRLQEIEQQKNQTKYVWTIIEHKRGRYRLSSSNGENGFIGPLENYIYYSDIIKVNDFNEDKKYLLQDELEDELRKQFRQSVHSIQNRQTFSFDSYSEASKHRFNLINK